MKGARLTPTQQQVLGYLRAGWTLKRVEGQWLAYQTSPRGRRYVVRQRTIDCLSLHGRIVRDGDEYKLPALRVAAGDVPAVLGEANRVNARQVTR